MRGDIAQGGEAREEVAGTLGGGSGSRGWCNDLDRCGAFVTHTLRGEGFDASEDGTGRGTPLVAVYENHGQDSRVKDLGDTCSTVSAKYGTGGGNTPIVCFDTAQITSPKNYSVPKPGDPAPPLNTAAQHHVAFTQNQREEVRDLGGVAGALRAAGGTHQDTYVAAFTTEQTPKCSEEKAFTITKQSPSGGGQQQCVAMVHWQQGGGEVEDNVSGALRANAEHSYQFARIQSTVRRLTPRECERLQGFPDDHTAVQYRNKPACDGPRYKALGNSMAVPCVEFILHNLLITESSAARP